ncbi:portal protein [Phenylobacterium sp.]|uniref:portal protein n=1 Tax=Phenylobacterium sp. TaxID=1871053 RepID=UPI002F3EF7EA
MTDDILKEAREAFELSADHEAENRREALDDLRFARLGEQWPEQVRRDRELDGRPCLTINRLPAFIRQVVNDARQNKPAIVCHPVDGAADPQTAEIFNGLIRHIEQSSDAEVAYDTALDFAVTGGFGYFRINTRYTRDDAFEQDIAIERVANPFSIYGDPNSTAADSSDWNTAFVVDSLPKAAFEARWKGADAVDWAADAYAGLNGPWLDGDQVMVAEYWRREPVKRTIVALSDGQVVELDAYRKEKALFDALGVSVVGRPREAASQKVTQRIMTGAEVLETVEWAGRFIPIVPVYGEELHVDGRRRLRGLVRDAKDPQRMFNYWRTTTTELVALAPKAPFIGRRGAFDTDAAKWASANVQTHAYLEYDGAEPPQRQPFAGVPAGAIHEALNAADDMKAIMGLHDASLGARSNETSGRAIMARQREGDVSTFHYIDNLARAIRHAGRILIDLIPKVYATPRVVRVLGPGGEAGLVPVNQKVQTKAPDADGRARAIERIYDLSAGRYDLTVRSGPSFTSRREEAATQMIELIRAYPPAAPLIGDLLAKNLDWPGADEVARRLGALLPQQVRGPAPEIQQAQAQMGQMGQALQAAKARIAALEQDRSHQARKLEIDAFEAQTNRMKVAGRHRRMLPRLEQGARLPAKIEAAQRISKQEYILHAGHHSDEGDALRHAEWSRRTADVAGPVFTKMAGWEHEIQGVLPQVGLGPQGVRLAPGQPLGEAAMDLRNNPEGVRASRERRPIDRSRLQTAPGSKLVSPVGKPQPCARRPTGKDGVMADEARLEARSKWRIWPVLAVIVPGLLISAAVLFWPRVGQYTVVLLGADIYAHGGARYF